MSVSVSEFWDLAEKSRLLPARTCAGLRAHWQELKGAHRASSARTLAEWLVAEGELTRYQAKLLLAGQPGPFYFGEYRICKRLRRGRLEDCFLAEHTSTKLRVTLRFVRGTAFEPTTHPEDVRQIFEQARRPDGPLVPYHEWVNCGAYQFGVFGALEGQPLAEAIAERGKFQVPLACQMVRDAGLTVAALHAEGRPHGAIRSETIWVADGRHVAVLPPQLSEPWDRLRGRKNWLNAGAEPAAISVAEFTAPECAGRAAAATPAGDVYSLGCLLYLLLAGRPPFTGANVAEVLQQHASEPCPPPSRRSMPTPLHRVLERMLAKDPDRRFADARLVANALTAFSPSPAPLASQPLAEEQSRRGAGLEARGPRANGTSQVSQPQANPTPEHPPAAFPVSPPASGALPVAKPLPLAPSPPLPLTAPRGQAAGASASLSARAARKRGIDWIAVGISALLAAVAAGGVILWHAGRDAAPVSDRDRRDLSGGQSPGEGDGTLPGRDVTRTTAERESEAAARERSIPDDGSALWASPTSGPPISAAFLPSGTQGILKIRLADLIGHVEGERIVAAAGPQLSGLLRALAPATGFAPEEIARLTLGLRVGEPASAESLCLVLQPAEAGELSLDSLRNRLPDALEVQIEGQAALVRGDRAFYVVEADPTPMLVICPAGDLAEILARSGTPPPLQREVEQLLASSDADRHVTLLMPPRLLLGDGRDFLSQHAAVLREPLQWFVGEGTKAVLLSAHWSSDFFLEMQAIAAADVPPWELRATLEEHLAEFPVRIGDQVLTADLEAYGLRVVGRLPEMVRRLVSYTRSAVEGERAVLRCYLPAPAGHNLLMASEILLAEMHSGSRSRSALPAENTRDSVGERLEQITSLSFSRDTLEAALDTLASDIGVPIEIRGSDLQLEGITKNQSFAIDLVDRPAREILIEILRLANPDKTATSAADPKQQLIFTIESHETAREAVYVTTRKAALERGVDLPPEFVAP